MDPQGPSQPSIDTAYENPKNPIDQTISEIRDASSVNSDPISDRRKHNDAIDGEGNDQSEATPSSLAYGALDASGDAGESVGGAVSNLEGEQMRAIGDGDIASAQDTKHGFGEQRDLASGLDRKKAEQAEIKDARRSGGGDGHVDVQGALGGRKAFVSGGGEGADSAQGVGMQSSHQHV